jgi:hypothetical protein
MGARVPLTRLVQFTIVVWIAVAISVIADLNAPNVSRWITPRPTAASTRTTFRRTTIAIVPYTVVLQEIAGRSHDTKGGVYTFALRSDGAQVEQDEFLSDKIVVRQRQLNFTSALRIDTDDVRELKSSIVEDAPLPLRDPGSDCTRSRPDTLSLPSQTVVGHVSVQGYRTIGIATKYTTTWFAVDLGCAPLRSTSNLGDQVSEKTAILITSGEPDSDLFAVGAQFKEVTPSVLFRSRSLQAAERRDSYYRAHHDRAASPPDR